MTCVLFSRWLTVAGEHGKAFVQVLRPHVPPDARVILLPFAHPADCDRDRYETKYGTGGAHHRSAVEAFAA